MASKATAGTYPSCQRCCAASAPHSGKTKGGGSPPPYSTAPALTMITIPTSRRSDLRKALYSSASFTTFLMAAPVIPLNIWCALHASGGSTLWNLQMAVHCVLAKSFPVFDGIALLSPVLRDACVPHACLTHQGWAGC